MQYEISFYIRNLLLNPNFHPRHNYHWEYNIKNWKWKFLHFPIKRIPDEGEVPCWTNRIYNNFDIFICILVILNHVPYRHTHSPLMENEFFSLQTKIEFNWWHITDSMSIYLFIFHPLGATCPPSNLIIDPDKMNKEISLHIMLQGGLCWGCQFLRPDLKISGK